MEYRSPKSSGKKSVKIIGELNSDGLLHTSKHGPQSWITAFAPDESRFAWASGEREIVLLPWNRYKNCLYEDNNDTEGHVLAVEKISIDTGFRVCSLAFGTGVPEKDLIPVQRGHWTRFDYTTDLVLATGHDNGRVRIWDPVTGKLLLDLNDGFSAITCLSFSVDGSLLLVSGSKDSSVKVWDIKDDGNMFKRLRGHNLSVHKVAWSSDSKLLCSVGDKVKAFIWDMERYEMRLQLSGHYHDILDCSFSPDGAMVATASKDTRVIIWNSLTGEQLRVLNHVHPLPGLIYMSGANDAEVQSVSFSPNGFHVASVCADGLVRFWNLMTNDDNPECVGYGLNEETMIDCSYSPAGGVLAVGHESGNVLLFAAPAEVPRLLHLSRMCVRRRLGNVSQDPDICIPHTLKPYLEYKHW